MRERREKAERRWGKIYTDLTWVRRSSTQTTDHCDAG
jgi:hypothetical protein